MTSSASRGVMATRKLIVFQHDSKLGSAPASALFARVTAERKSPDRPVRSFEDYHVVVRREGLPAGVAIQELM